MEETLHFLKNVRTLSGLPRAKSDIDEALQPPAVSAELTKSLQPIIDKLPDGYAFAPGANMEDSGKANAALAAVFPIMIVCMLTLVFLPALYSIWFRVIPSAKRHSSPELATQ